MYMSNHLSVDKKMASVVLPKIFDNLPSTLAMSGVVILPSYIKSPYLLNKSFKNSPLLLLLLGTYIHIIVVYIQQYLNIYMTS